MSAAPPLGLGMHAILPDFNRVLVIQSQVLVLAQQASYQLSYLLTRFLPQLFKIADHHVALVSLKLVESPLQPPRC